MNYWLFKTEPNEFSIEDLETKGIEGECWEGIRNYQARNFIRDKMQVGDLVFVYHSSCKNVGIVGTGKIIKAAFPDPFQFDPESKYFDYKSTKEDPRWFSVQLQFQQKIMPMIPLSELKEIKSLEGFQLLKRGNRLSIFPVSEQHWNTIIELRK